MHEIKQPSKKWYDLYHKTEGLIILSYDGWDKDLNYSFNQEKVTHDEFLDRLKKSKFQKND